MSDYVTEYSGFAELCHRSPLSASQVVVIRWGRERHIDVSKQE